MEFIEQGYPKDQFLISNNAVERLLKEWDKYDRLIVAYDFDHTVYDTDGTGETYNQVIELLKECQNCGCTMIVFTCRPPEEYDFVKNHLDSVGLRYDYINENVPDLDFKTSNKIYFSILFDDRAGLPSAYETMVNVLYKRFNNRG